MARLLRMPLKLCYCHCYQPVFLRQSWLIGAHKGSTVQGLQAAASINTFRNEHQSDQVFVRLPEPSPHTPLDFSGSLNSRKTLEILRAFLTLRLCAVDAFTSNALPLMNAGQRLLGKKLFSKLMEATFFGHFVCAGTDEAISRIARQCEVDGVSVMPFRPVECGFDHLDFLEREKAADENAGLFCTFVHLANRLCPELPIAQFKLTGFIAHDLLERLGEHCMAKGGFADTNRELELAKEFAAYMSGEKKELNVPFLKDDELLVSLKNTLKRCRSLGKAAEKQDVRLLLDAEYTFMNPGLAAISLAMMIVFNRTQGRIWFTYQCYLKETMERLHTHREHLARQGIHFGCKIVRGAYLEHEGKRALRLGYENPCQPSYEATSQNYSQVMKSLISESVFGNGHCKFMVATHNADSVTEAVNRLQEASVPASDRSVVFAQIYGMADHISLALAKTGRKVYKSVPCGTVEESLPYLSRRAVENNSFGQLARADYRYIKNELKTRVTGRRHMYHS